MTDEVTVRKRDTLPLSAVHLLMVISATLVSTSFTVGAAITEALDPALLTLVRFSLAAFLFAPWGVGFLQLLPIMTQLRS